MEAKELRAGNFVDHARVESFVEWSLGMFECLNDGTINIDNFSPIPITDELLIKFGFEKKWIYPKNHIHPEGWYVWELPFFTLSDNFCYQFSGTRTEIKYVHRLQNLYFALTGQELILQ
jgi:hypothetical protein